MSTGDEQRDWDGVWKRVMEHFPAQALDVVCGVDVTGAEVTALPTERQRPVLLDRVFSVRRPGGAEEVVHVEVQVRAEPRFELRLATYYTLLAAEHDTVSQVVVMPVGGRYSGTFTHGPLTLRYGVVDVPRLDPAVLLAGPLAPLALWSSPEPERVIDIVADTIAATEGHEARATLAELAILGRKDLADMVVAALEARGMSNVLIGTRTGDRLLAQGRAEGREEGREEGRAAMLRALLTKRFGPDAGLSDVADRLAADDDAAGTIDRIWAAGSLEDLQQSQ